MDVPWPDERPKKQSRIPINLYKYLIIILDVVVIGGIVIGVVTFYDFYRGRYDPPAPVNYAQGHFKQIADPFTNRTLDLTINLYSPTLSAQSPIGAYVALKPSSLDVSRDLLLHNKSRDYYQIWFPGTYCYVPQSKYDRIFPCWMPLNPDPTIKSRYDVRFVGNMTLYYAYGGTFDAAIGDQITGFENSTSVGEEFIRISSVDATNSFNQAQNTYNTWKVAVLIAATAGLAAVAQLIIRLHWYLWNYLSGNPKH